MRSAPWEHCYAGKDSAPRLVFVDDIGRYNFIPIVDAFVTLSRKKLARILKRERYSRTIKLIEDAERASKRNWRRS